MLNKFIKLNLPSLLNLIALAVIILITMGLYTSPLLTANGICRPPCVSTVGDTCCEARPCCTQQGLTCQYGLCVNNNPPTPTYQSLNKSLFVWNPSPVDIDQNTPIQYYNAVGTKISLGTIPTWELLLQNYNKTADTLINFCVTQGFKRIYLFIGSTQWNYTNFYSNNILPYADGIKYIIQQAQANNISVFAFYYLNDSGDNITSADIPKIQALIKTILQFNTNNPTAQFDGIIGDLEPVSLTMPGGVNTNYLQVLQTIQTQLKAANSTMQTAAVVTPLMLKAHYNPGNPPTIPATTLTNDPLFLQSILPLVDYPVILAYSNTVAGVQNIITPPGTTNLIPAGQAFEIAVETGWNGATAGETFSAEIKSPPTQFMADILTIANQNPQATIGIHDFAQYFVDLNQVDPYCYNIPSCVHIISTTSDICTLYNNAKVSSDTATTTLLSSYATSNCTVSTLKTGVKS